MISKNPVPRQFPDDGYLVSDAEMSRRRRTLRTHTFQEAEDFLQNERIVISWELDKTGL